MLEMSAATRTRGSGAGVFAFRARGARRRLHGARRRLAAAAPAGSTLGALAVVASAILLASAAAGEPSQYVPARIGGWPPWLSGPLHPFEAILDPGTFQTLT